MAFAGFALLLVCAAHAKVEIIQFDDPRKAALYNDLIVELRCLVCQNQNLADSNADLAVDLRRRTRELVDQGKSREEIASYMVSRYGEFVLYRPPLNAANLVLWVGPGVLLVLAIGITLYRRNSRKTAWTTLNDEERAKLRDMLDSNGT